MPYCGQNTFRQATPLLLEVSHLTFSTHNLATLITQVNKGDWIRFIVNQYQNTNSDSTQFSIFIGYEDKNAVHESEWSVFPSSAQNELHLTAPAFVSYSRNVNDRFLVYTASQNGSQEVVAVGR